MGGNPRAFVGPWESVQDVALLTPASASASPVPGGARECNGDRPLAGVGRLRGKRPPCPGLDWVSLQCPPLPPGSEVRVTNPCLCPSASGGMGVGDLSVPAFTNPWVARLPV